MGNKWENYQPRFKDLISLRQASKITGLTTNHLRLMISRGKLWARKIDSLWVTTEEALSDYLKNREKPGRKPKKPL
jgi:hypothetical protein